MSYKIIILHEKIFAKDISSISEKERKTIFNKIEQLKQEGTTNVQVKKLKNYPVADFRLRVGNYRVLFNISIETKEIIILRVLHRSNLY